MQNFKRLLTVGSYITKNIPVGKIQYNKNILQIATSRYCSNGSIFSIESVEEFDEKVMNSPDPVLVDFYADWCTPCQQLGPRLEAKVANFDGAISLAKINVDEVGNLADEFEIASIPTIIAIKHGEVVGKFEGMVDDETLDQFIADVTEN
uniref:Thioredoxin domain-containing protein n=1 Tax=Parastrongyloides trichosuri TaxID=131310 RepID=A0A0N4ZVA8_PARTI